MTALDGFDLRPGSKNRMTVKVEGTQVKMPMSIITGAEEGPTVLVTAGIHGCEYPGILALIELTRDLEPSRIKGRLIAVHPVNTLAFTGRISMILPEDGCNILRVFPGSPTGSPAERVAWRITEFQDLSDFHLDLHSGDLYEKLDAYAYVPGVGGEEVIQKSIQAVKYLNMPYFVRSMSKVGTIGSGALRGTPSILIERSGAGQCYRRDVDLYKKDLINMFKYLGLLAGEPEQPETEPVEISGVVYLESKHNALWAPLVEVGEKVRAGQKIGEILDFFGETLETYQAEHDGVVLYRLGTLSTNAGDVLMCY